MSPFDLYATVESMIGFDAEYHRLHEHYLACLAEKNVRTLLDVGCGNGALLVKLAEAGYEAQGIELSETMAERARIKGCRVCVTPLEELDESYDAILAVGDVLNYMTPAMVLKFMESVSQRLRPGGWFLADVNTLHGFEEVTSGVMVAEEGERFLAIEAEFDGAVLETEITLFERENRCYIKHQGKILQYYHEAESLQIPSLQCKKIQEIALFSDESDKILLKYQKQ